LGSGVVVRWEAERFDLTPLTFGSVTLCFAAGFAVGYFKGAFLGATGFAFVIMVLALAAG